MNSRAQHKKQMRQDILDAASAIIVQEGIRQLTIRKIAAVIGYSVPMVYEHFLNKEALLKELQKEWLQNMQDMIQTIYFHEKDPTIALEKIAVAYLKFAQEKPDFYRAVMGLDLSQIEGKDDFYEIHTLRMVLKEIIQQILGGQAALDVLEDQVDLFRSFLHGVVALMLVNKIKGGEARALALVKSGVNAVAQKLTR